MRDNTFPTKNTVNVVLIFGGFATPSLGVKNQATSIGMFRPLFPDHTHRPIIHLWL